MTKPENPQLANTRRLALLESGKYHDFTITCGSCEWKVHRVILCPKSKYFETACGEDSFKEGTSRIINLQDDEANIVDHMLRFLYASDYPDNAEGSDQLLVNAKVYALADKYQIGPLKDLAKEKFSAALKSGWDIVNFPEVIEAVYRTTLASDRALRDCLAPFMKKHIEELRKHKGFMGLVSDRLADGEFADGFIDAWAGHHQGPLRCRHCGKT